MRARFATAVLFVALGAAAGFAPRLAAQADNSGLSVMPQAQLDVVKVLLAQERQWNEGKLDDFLTGYKNAPETTFIGETVQHGWNTLVQRYHNTYPNRETMGTLSFSDLSPRLLDDRYAAVTGRYHLERARKSGGNADGVFSLLLEKTAEGWKIVLDHTS